MQIFIWSDVLKNTEFCLRSRLVNFVGSVVFFNQSDFLHIFYKFSLNLIKFFIPSKVAQYKCCVFWPAFGCYTHAEACQNTFLDCFQPILLKTLAAWRHKWWSPPLLKKCKRTNPTHVGNLNKRKVLSSMVWKWITWQIAHQNDREYLVHLLHP